MVIIITAKKFKRRRSRNKNKVAKKWRWEKEENANFIDISSRKKDVFGWKKEEIIFGKGYLGIKVREEVREGMVESRIKEKG